MANTLQKMFQENLDQGFPGARSLSFLESEAKDAFEQANGNPDAALGRLCVIVADLILLAKKPEAQTVVINPNRPKS